MIRDYITVVLNTPILVWKGGPNRRCDGPEAAKYWQSPKNAHARTFSTVNRHLPLLRAVFERAYNTRDPIMRERAIEAVPVIKDLPEPKRKARPVPDDVLSDVLATVPAHIKDAILATLYFGFRKSEVFALQRHHVDFQAGGIRLEHDEVKNDADTFMPGSRDAMQFLAPLVDQSRNRNTTYLFTWHRTYKDPQRQAAAPWLPVKSPKRAWNTAMERVQAKFGKRWRWHDIRAAFITHVAITSGGIVAQKLARHADFDTTQGYIAVADDVARAAAERASKRPALSVGNGGKT
jgi:integrase